MMNAPSFTLAWAKFPSDRELIRSLLDEYRQESEAEICFSSFEHEIGRLDEDLQRPAGEMLLAKSAQDVAGCVAWKRVDQNICELRRLFVRNAFRGHGLGRSLVNELARTVKSYQFNAIRLHTLPEMTAAIGLYQSLGFVLHGGDGSVDHCDAMYYELLI